LGCNIQCAHFKVLGSLVLGTISYFIILYFQEFLFNFWGILTIEKWTRLLGHTVIQNVLINVPNSGRLHIARMNTLNLALRAYKPAKLITCSLNLKNGCVTQGYCLQELPILESCIDLYSVQCTVYLNRILILTYWISKGSYHKKKLLKKTDKSNSKLELKLIEIGQFANIPSKKIAKKNLTNSKLELKLIKKVNLRIFLFLYLFYKFSK